MKIKVILVSVLTLVVFLYTGCATKLSDKQIDSMVQMEKIVPEPEKVYIPVETVRYVFPEEGQVIEQKGRPLSEHELIENAEEKSTETITSAVDFSNTIVEYDFQDGKIYTIIATPDAVADLRLQPTESISGSAAIGDPTRWQFEVSTSTEKGQSVTHLFIRPSTSGLQTTMIIPTNYRTYYINLRSTESISMLGVRFRYPMSMTFSGSEVIDSTGNAVSHSNETLVNTEQIDFAYKIDGKDSLTWKPTGVYSDGIRTYIQMDPRFTSSTGAPALYLLPKKNSSDSNLEVINYRVKGNIYIVDFVITDKQALMLMAYTGNNKKEKVLITKD